MVSSACHEGSRNSTVSGSSLGHASRNAARRESSRLDVSGARTSTVPSRSPKARYGPVSQGSPGSGDPPNAPHVPPRWAFTLNRNVPGVAATQAATLAADGCW